MSTETFIKSIGDAVTTPTESKHKIQPASAIIPCATANVTQRRVNDCVLVIVLAILVSRNGSTLRIYSARIIIIIYR